MARLSIGIDIREVLIEADGKGIVIADLFSDWRKRKTLATYNSFAKYFWLLKKLGFVEEAATPREPGPKPELEERRYFKITTKGRAARDYQWSNPIRTFYDSVYGEGAWEKYMASWRVAHPYQSTGKKQGRPPKIQWSE